MFEIAVIGGWMDGVGRLCAVVVVFFKGIPQPNVFQRPSERDQNLTNFQRWILIIWCLKFPLNLDGSTKVAPAGIDITVRHSMQDRGAERLERESKCSS